MKIKNEYSKEVLVYFYKPSDTVYVAALAERKIPTGVTKGYREDAFPNVKISIRDGVSIFDSQIVKPGELFDMRSDYILDKDGKLIKAVPSLDAAEVKNKNLRTYIFFDAREYNEKTTRTIVSSFSSAFSQSEGFADTYERTQEFSIGGNIAGWIGNKENGKKGGSASVSVEFRDVVTQTLSNTYEKAISQAWGKSSSDEFTFQPGKLYAIEVVWQVQIQEGVIKYFGEQSAFSVINSADGSLTVPVAYDNEAEMPETIRQAYNNLVEFETLDNVIS